MARGVRLPAQHPLERGPELRTEDGVDDRVERRVEVAEPEEERHQGVVELVVLEDGHHDGKDEEGQPASDEGPGDDGQRLGGLPLALGLERHVLLLARLARAAVEPVGLGFGRKFFGRLRRRLLPEAVPRPPLPLLLANLRLATL